MSHLGALHPHNEVMTPHGLCEVVKPITWTQDGIERVFGYWVLPRFGDMRQVHVDDIERVPTVADFAWAVAKVRAVTERVAQ
jgi:hypothetical protein